MLSIEVHRLVPEEAATGIASAARHASHGLPGIFETRRDGRRWSPDTFHRVDRVIIYVIIVILVYSYSDMQLLLAVVGAPELDEF